MRNPKSAPLILTLLVAASFAFSQEAQTDEWAIKPPKGKILPMDEILRLGRMQSAVVDEGVKAQARGDYATAERDFRRACTFMGHDDTPQHLFLARLYDQMDQGRRALAEYRIILTGNEYIGFSSDWRDIGILTHVGDLCLKFGTVADARQAYNSAVSVGASEPYGGVLAYARNDTMDALRSAAHAAYAIHDYWSSRSVFQKELEIAVQADERNWVARTWRAISYRAQKRDAEATKEAMIAESLAPAKDRERVRTMRWRYQIVDAEGNLPPDPSAKPLPRPVLTKP